MGENTHEQSHLYRAVSINDEAAVIDLLNTPDFVKSQLEWMDPTTGWTPLFVACVQGSEPIVKLLVGAGACQETVDLADWTSKEHAVFRGHLNLAKSLPHCDLVPHASLKPPPQHKVRYERQSSKTQIFVYLGPCHTRSNLAPVEINLPGLENQPFLRVCVGVKGIKDASHDLALPLNGIMVNEPQTFFVDNADETVLTFEIFHVSTENESGTLLGTAMGLLKSFRTYLAPKHESLGSLPEQSAGFWKKSSGFPIVGHRGSGANNMKRDALQLGENTYRSFLTAVDRGALGIEFDVQLTKDFQPIIYHDFLVKETGGDIPVHNLTIHQFQHYSRSQAPKSDRFSSREQLINEQAFQNSGVQVKPRRHSLNEYDDSRCQDLLERIKHTDEGLKGSFKGNIWGCSIQEPSTTLRQLLERVPEHVSFDLEIKYLMLWEAEDRAMEFTTIEINSYIDTILDTIFLHCGQRDITLTSFSPEVCIALACKQENFPVLQISKAGTVPVSDVRAGSLKGALDFATAWSLDGVVVISDPFVLCPRLLRYAKDMGLVVASYGDLNNDVNCAKIQINAGLDAIITDKVHLLSGALHAIED